MPGINEVAQLAGVSTATVSRALSGNGHVSEATRQRVHAAALELGYVVSSNASGLATGRTKNVGVVIPFLNRWYYGAVLEGAESALLGHGYDLTLYNLGGGGDERRLVFEHFLLRKRVDAVIAIALELTESEVGRLHDMTKPIVGVGGTIQGVRTLSIDDPAVAHLATEHLLSLGHKVIAHIGGNSDSEMDFHVPTRRRNGYEAALREAGIEPDPESCSRPRISPCRADTRRRSSCWATRASARPRCSRRPTRWRSERSSPRATSGCTCPTTSRSWASTTTSSPSSSDPPRSRSSPRCRAEWPSTSSWTSSTLATARPGR